MVDFPGVEDCGTWGTTGHNNGKNPHTNVGFVSELGAGGNSLVYSCYIPGALNATAARVAVVPSCSSNCDAYIVGSTQSTAATDGFIVTSNAAQAELASGENGLSNGFMMVVGGGGSAAAPVYSTYYGGTASLGNGDAGIDISAESATQVAITGAAFSNNIPTKNATQATFLGATNSTSMAFAAHLRSDPDDRRQHADLRQLPRRQRHQQLARRRGDWRPRDGNRDRRRQIVYRGRDRFDQFSGQRACVVLDQSSQHLGRRSGDDRIHHGD